MRRILLYPIVFVIVVCRQACLKAGRIWRYSRAAGRLEDLLSPLRSYLLRRRMLRKGDDPDRPLSRQERRRLQQLVEKQARKAFL